MLVAPLSEHLGRRRLALRHAVSPVVWRDALRADVRKASFAAPLRVGAAVAAVFVVGGLTGAHDVAGFAALGALVAAFCRPDPYPVRRGRLAVLAVAITAAVGIGATCGALGTGAAVDVVVVSALAGAAAYLVWALHVVGPGAVVFVFAAVGARGFAHDAGDVGRLVVITAAGAAIGMFAALAPWALAAVRRGRDRETAVVAREPLWLTVVRAPHATLLARSARIAVAGAAGAAIAFALGLPHPMWAAMGAVATMQGVGYHVTIHRGVQRLLGNVAGALVAAGLLALPLGYWGAVVAIVVLQTAAEIASTVNYALTSLAITPMALLLTGIGSGLAPAVAVDRILDTVIGVVVGIVVAAVTMSGADAHHLRRATSAD